MTKKKPLTKEQIEALPLSPFVADLSYVRFKDGRIVPGIEPRYTKREFWPNEGVYKPKIKRA